MINVIPKRVRDNDNTCLICDETTAEDLISVSEISWGKLSEYGLLWNGLINRGAKVSKIRSDLYKKLSNVKVKQGKLVC